MSRKTCRGLMTPDGRPARSRRDGLRPAGVTVTRRATSVAVSARVAVASNGVKTPNATMSQNMDCSGGVPSGIRDRNQGFTCW